MKSKFLKMIDFMRLFILYEYVPTSYPLALVNL